MIRRPPRSPQGGSSAASDVYKRQLPGGYDGSAGTIPGGYPFTEQITDPAARTRALTCELQNGRAAMLGTFGAMCHSCVDSCDHHFFYPITHN